MTLLTAATPWESRPLAKALGLAPDPQGRAFIGSVAGEDVRLIETGMGELNTGRALASETSAARVIAVGFAGALQPGIRSGDLVADLHGAPLLYARRARAAARRLGLPLHVGRFHTAPAVVASPGEKARLGREHRAVAIEMEGSAVRRWAEAGGADYLSVRAVFDALEDRPPADLPASDSLPDALRYLFSHAGELPSLLGLALRQRAALKRLTSFLREFLLSLSDGKDDEDIA